MKNIKRTKFAPQTLYIKNMVCDRCIRVVREELQLLGLNVLTVMLGEAHIDNILTRENILSIQSVLQNNGFELLEDKNARVIESVKTAIIQFVHHKYMTLTAGFQHGRDAALIAIQCGLCSYLRNGGGVGCAL